MSRELVRSPSRAERRPQPGASATGRLLRGLAALAAVTRIACTPLVANEMATSTAPVPGDGSMQVTPPLAERNARELGVTRRFGVDDHRGEDWTTSGALGAAVVVIAAGEVVFAGNGDRDGFTGWGNVVIVRHHLPRAWLLPDEAIESLYGHLEDVRVRAGERVERGRVVGTVGTGGGRYAPHLHFEIRERLGLGIQAGSGPLDGWLDPSEWLRERGAALVVVTHRTP